MKKFVLSLASLALLVCVFATAAFANDVTYTVADVNLRQGPGTQYPVITVIPSGAAVYMEEPDTGSGWTIVDYGNASGYVATKYLLYGQNIAASASAGSNFTAGNYNVIDYVNLRTGPGMDYPVQIVVPSGASIYIDSVANGWAHTSFANYDGYVSAKYVAGLGSYSAPAATVTSNTGPSGNAGNNLYYVTGNVNLRTGPGTDYGALLVIPNGAGVNVTDYANGWAHVNYGGYVGYVSTKYISGLGGVATYQTPTAPAVNGTTIYQGIDYANVYNYNYYYQNYKDVVNALGSSPAALIEHFVHYGMYEGRQGNATFNVYTFIEQHPELQARYGTDLRKYYLYACGIE